MIKTLLDYIWNTLNLNKIFKRKDFNILKGKEVYTFKDSLNNVFNIRYGDIKKINNNNSNTLYITSHRYEHIDVIATVLLLKKLKKKNINYIAYNKIWNKVLYKILHLLFDPNHKMNHNIMFSKNSLVDKSIEILNKENNNIVIYKYDQRNSKKKQRTGIFHIVKNTNCKVMLIRIKCKKQIQNDHNNSSYLKILTSYYNLNFDITIEDFNQSINDSANYLYKLDSELYD